VHEDVRLLSSPSSSPLTFCKREPVLDGRDFRCIRTVFYIYALKKTRKTDDLKSKYVIKMMKTRERAKRSEYKWQQRKANPARKGHIANL
jgi:hypothetical protein